MYSQFFGLQKNPFSQLTRQNKVYLSDSHQLVFNQLVESIEKSTGIVSLLGPAGVGKSTFIAHLVETFLQDKAGFFYKDLSALSTEEWSDTSRHDYSSANTAGCEDIAHISNDHCKSVYLLDVIDTINEDSLIKLLNIIAGRNASNNPSLLILVGRCNLEQLLSTAQSVLDKNLFKGTSHINPLNAAEVRNYMSHRIHAVHYSGASLFTEDAIGAITTLSNGIPRHINTISGMSLFQAEKKRLSVVTEKQVYEAAECCFLEDDSTDFLLKEDIEKTGTPDPVPASAPRQNTGHFTGNNKNLFPFRSFGTVLIILSAATVIGGIQWYSASQPASDPEGMRLALDAADFNNTEGVQDQSTESQTNNPEDEIQDLLAQARVLEQKNRLTLPKNNNAIAAYQHILDVQPGNIEAVQAIERIKQQFIQQAEQAISQSQWTKAQSNLIKAKQIDPSGHAVNTLLADVRSHLTQTIESSQNSMIDQQELAARSRANARYQLNEKGIDFDLINFFSLAKHGNTDLVALFLDANIPVDAQDPSLGDTALIKAATYGHLNTVKLILSKQADINIQNRIGRTALMNAIILEKHEVVFTLLNQEADINIKDQNGWNALMFAVEKNQPAIVEALLRKGAKKNVRNILGKSALSIAKENSNNTIISLLQSTR